MAKKSNQTILNIDLTLEMVVHNISPRMNEGISHSIVEHLRKGLSAAFINTLNPPLPLYKAPVFHIGTAQPMLVTSSSPCSTQVVDWIGDHPNPRHFLVTSRDSLHRGITDMMGASTNGVKVQTPVLRLGSWRFAVERALKALSTASDINIEFTQYCGLYVHINRRGGFDLRHIKGLAKAAVVFETDIENAFHPKHRCGGAVDKKIHADSNRTTSLSLKVFTTALEMVRLIEQQDAVSDVRSTICDEDAGHRDFKYNFQSLVEAGGVEFRQAQGTLDGTWVVRWVEMLVNFVKAAEVVTEALFEEFAKAADRGEDRLTEFLEWGMGGKDNDDEAEQDSDD